MGLDPVTLAGEILTVLVIDAEVFNEVFADVVAWNSEGDVVFGADGSVGVPAAQACIELAWDHQEMLARQAG